MASPKIDFDPTKLKESRIAIISHVYSPGPPHELEAYLKDKVEELFFVGHPLDFVKNKPSLYRHHRNGKLVSELEGRVWNLPSLLTYVKDVIANLYWGMFVFPKLDYIIALNNINAATAIWLRGFGRTKKVVFYTIDYIPNRFNNPTLNNFYHGIDNYAVKLSDYVWNLSPIMVKMRQKKGIGEEYTAKQITVPIGTHILPIEKVKKDPKLMIFMGHLRPGQGADLLLDAMPEILKKDSKIKLRLIGGGPLEKELREQAKALRVDEAVEFTGFVPTNEEMRRMLLEGTVAVAPYVDDDSTYTRYTDPGKPKEYLAAGLPVIITKVPAFAEVIEKRKAGKAIRYDKSELAAAVVDLLNHKDIATYQKNAKDLAAESTWDKVFDAAFQKMTTTAKGDT